MPSSWHMAGTEGSGEYIVVFRSGLGRVGYRAIGNAYRVRVEPQSAGRASIARVLTQAKGWKQPGDEGQSRFSTVVSEEQLFDVLETAISSLDPQDSEAELNPSAPAPIQKIVTSLSRRRSLTKSGGERDPAPRKNASAYEGARHQLFISYNHTDEPLRVELDKHLVLLKRQGALDVWTDHRILPGSELNNEISASLDDADIILLLVSSDFLASEYCFSIEMKRAMERHREKTAVVIPLILRPCDWQSAPFGRLKALPSDGRPVVKWPSHDDAFLDVVQSLRKLLTTGSSLQSSPRHAKAPPATPRTESVSVQTRSSNLALRREFTDQEKHDFAEATFDYVRSYFDSSLGEMQTRDPSITGKLREKSRQGFAVVVFRNGKRLAGCYVRLGGMLSSTSIAYSGSEESSDNSYNELLSVEADKQGLFLHATMGMFHGGRDTNDKLSQEAAAEHLWSMLISSLQ